MQRWLGCHVTSWSCCCCCCWRWWWWDGRQKCHDGVNTSVLRREIKSSFRLLVGDVHVRVMLHVQHHRQITRLPSNLLHLIMRAFSYAWSLPVTWQRWRSHKSICCCRKPHATRNGSMFCRTGVMATRSFTLLEYGFSTFFAPLTWPWPDDLHIRKLPVLRGVSEWVVS